MVRISENMIRKRAEHNNCELSTLEEVSLHQQDIERIEFIDKWCRELQILYLQSNLIPKIENVGRLKKLKYLNLALNNVERVENLEGCESLQKLDLTVNFVGELTSIESLKENYNLKELFLTGNPCTEYDSYRDYVIATLPQLQRLDSQPIEKSARILAMQNYGVIRAQIIQQELQYKKKREREREEAKRKAAEKEQQEKEEEEKEAEEKGDDESSEARPGFDKRWYTDINEEDKAAREQREQEKRKKEEEERKQFWEEKTAYTPESRIEVHEHLKKLKEKEQGEKEQPKPVRKLFAEDGRPLNVNEPKVDFTLTENEAENCLVLDISCYKHLDTALIDCDVQPDHVRAVLKGKIFQLALMEEVLPDSSSAQRSQVTGHLVIKMPRAREMVKPKARNTPPKAVDSKRNKENEGPQLLEVDESCRKTVDIAGIVDEKPRASPAPLGSHRVPPQERPNSADFVDDPDVPPLM